MKTWAICFGFILRRLKAKEENPNGYERIEVDVCGGRKEKSDEQLGFRDRRRSEFVVGEVRKQFGELGEGEAEKERT